MKKLAFLALFATSFIYAQEPKNVISITDMFEMALSNSSDMLILNGLEIQGSIDHKYLEDKFNLQLDSRNKLIINKHIFLKNCVLDALFRRIVLKSLVLEDVILKSIEISLSTINRLRLENNTGSNGAFYFSGLDVDELRIQNCDLTNSFLAIQNVNINKKLVLFNNNLDVVRFSDVIFNQNLDSIPKFQRYILKAIENYRDPDESEIEYAEWRNFGRKYYYSPILLIQGTHDLDFFRCKFSSINISERFDIKVNANSLDINDCTFTNPTSIYSNIANRLNISNNVFQKKVSLYRSSLPEFNKYIPYSQFKDGLGVFADIDQGELRSGARCESCILYSGEFELKNITHKGEENEAKWIRQYYDQLLYSYELIYQNSKSRGEIESANAAYVALKELELSRLKAYSDFYGGFNNYFRWKLSQLLKVYTNHGTNPATAIVVSMYVIIAFAIFYFFFPSEWDITSKSKLIKDFKDFTQKNDKGYMKPFFSLVLGFIISMINALTLSLNAFTTLGFGRIPTKGLAKYVCVIQGFIGWFLLSIFTVALINQVLA